MALPGTYDQAYVDACRARSESQVAVFRWARYGVDAQEDARFDDLESEYFNNMLLVLDGYFAQRDPGREGAGTPGLAEVRGLVRALVLNGGTVLGAEAEDAVRTGGEVGTEDGDRSESSAASSLLGYRRGDPVRLTADQYAQLSNAVFTEIERHFIAH